MLAVYSTVSVTSNSTVTSTITSQSQNSQPQLQLPVPSFNTQAPPPTQSPLSSPVKFLATHQTFAYTPPVVTHTKHMFSSPPPLFVSNRPPPPPSPALFVTPPPIPIRRAPSQTSTLDHFSQDTTPGFISENRKRNGSFSYSTKDKFPRNTISIKCQVYTARHSITGSKHNVECFKIPTTPSMSFSKKSSL